MIGPSVTLHCKLPRARGFHPEQRRRHMRHDRPRLVLLVHAMKRTERIPLVLRAYGCAPDIFAVVVLVYRSGLKPCREAVAASRSSPGRACRRCSCFVARSEPEYMHLNIAALADGTADLLFTHMDGFVNASMLPLLRRHNETATPAGGLSLHGQPVEPACISLDSLAHCSGDAKSANVTCGGRTWAWWSHSHIHCLAASSALGIKECCYGWSDLVYLPAHTQAAFRRLAAGASGLVATARIARTPAVTLEQAGSLAALQPASTDMRAVFHEVAIPTILNAMRLPRWGGMPWRRVRCLGSCCTGVNSPTFESGGPHLCAHKVHLPALVQERPKGRPGWRWPYRGFLGPHSCAVR